MKTETLVNHAAELSKNATTKEQHMAAARPWSCDNATGDTFWNCELVGKIAFGNHGIALETLLDHVNEHAALVAVAEAAAKYDSFLQSVLPMSLKNNSAAANHPEAILNSALAALAAIRGQ